MKERLEETISDWIKEGLMAIFFLYIGLELERELYVGELSSFRSALLPLIAAVGGMALPAVLFVAVILLAGDREALHGWAIPTATDIAFALAVLAIFGRGLPRALRTFLLTLAVVDDLLAIIVIAVFYNQVYGFLTQPWLQARDMLSETNPELSTQMVLSGVTTPLILAMKKLSTIL